MTTEFDAQKALKEELSGLSEVAASLVKTERRAQQRLAEAEEEFNAVSRIGGFLQAEIARKRAALEAIYDAQRRNE